jgi:3-dehydroquinate synthase
VSATLPVSYDVRIVSDLLAPDNDALERYVFAGRSRRRLLVVDQTVLDLYAQPFWAYLVDRRLPATVVTVGVDETHKDLGLSLRIARAADDFGLDRRAEPIVAMGGGVLLDVVGFAAGMYRRGTPYIRIPTTLVGLVDAGVGVKTGVNHNGHKNRLGAYHPPVLTLLDPSFLRTLPDRHISNGLAEVAKVALMCDPELWRTLVEHADTLVASRLGSREWSAPRSPGRAVALLGQRVVAHAVHDMLTELQPNLWETDLYRLVDFGHTFSPAMEMATMPELLHGEAVALDMALSCVLSAHRGLLSDRELAEVLTVLVRLGLPVTHPAVTPEVLASGLQDAVRHRAGRQRLPVPVHPGQAVFLEDVTLDELVTCQQWLADFLASRPAGWQRGGPVALELADALG